MDESARIGKKKWKVSTCTFLLLFPVLTHIPPSPQSRDTTQSFSRNGDTTAVFRSAFPPRQTDVRPTRQEKGTDTHYTIQVCTRYVLIDDVFLTGLYSVKPIRMGDLYRYIYSGYATLEEARKDLAWVKIYYPKAFIREYDGLHLGNAIDLTY